MRIESSRNGEDGARICGIVDSGVSMTLQQPDYFVELTPPRHGGIVLIGVFLIGVVIFVGALALLVRGMSTSYGDDMERPNRVAQLYGYAVCLITVVVFLASANSFVENLFTFGNPVRGTSGNFGEASVTSFEAYRSTVNRFSVPGRDAGPGRHPGPRRPAGRPDPRRGDPRH